MLRIKKSFIYHEVLHLLLHMQMIIGQIWSCWSNSSLTQSHTVWSLPSVCFPSKDKGGQSRPQGLRAEGPQARLPELLANTLQIPHMPPLCLRHFISMYPCVRAHPCSDVTLTVHLFCIARLRLLLFD